MAAASLQAMVQYCDRELRVRHIQDYEGAVNGLQVENEGRVRRIAAAVDASLATVKMAIAAQADLLVVHHGLFWGPVIPWTGRKRELLQLLLGHNLAVYSVHLPLDMHPRLGNNACLARALGWQKCTPFFNWKNQLLGLQTRLRLPRAELAARLERAVGGPVKLIPGGPDICRRVGLVTGGAGGDLKTAAAEGVDTFITGEGPHWTYALAEELQMNVLYAGHYATETFGVKALAEQLSRKFRVPWVFLDHPTGL
ncbi:Nif3-like dinuclear metal center hexameric protein [Fontisphaera persica]|uniref:Nif3-like dinuclear metal center hexameric protein n=1 Tax=Fontisphaera persica TaxID=2974023 RepID=UPI0024BF46C3|nr:Nif3-like dinuclear metal center hexameric protein [Fontisphaera persica]WCJ59197.1 Nif3-like dinuclear metal center hexameric protein [Fontisphaera persica]